MPMKIKPDYDLMEEACEHLSSSGDVTHVWAQMTLLELASVAVCEQAGYEKSYYNRPYASLVKIVKKSALMQLAYLYIEKIEHDYLGDSQDEN